MDAVSQKRCLKEMLFQYQMANQDTLPATASASDCSPNCLGSVWEADGAVAIWCCWLFESISSLAGLCSSVSNAYYHKTEWNGA